MLLLEEQICTMDDICNLPNTIRAELIDGQLYMMASPSTEHQRISMNISSAIHQYIRSGKGSCEVFSAPFAVYLHGDESEYFEPDISVISDPNKINDKGCMGAPDWIIEITSPSSLGHDYILKLNKYSNAGVKEYWIINPGDRSVTVYFFEGGKFAQHYDFNDKIKVNFYEDLYIDFPERIESMAEVP